jgi:hypothetical protein
LKIYIKIEKGSAYWTRYWTNFWVEGQIRGMFDRFP